MKLQLFEQKQAQFEAMMLSMLNEMRDMRSSLIDSIKPSAHARRPRRCHFEAWRMDSNRWRERWRRRPDSNR